METANKTIYILEEKWYQKWYFTYESDSMEWIIKHKEDLEKRLGKYIKLEFRIREKGVKEPN